MGPGSTQGRLFDADPHPAHRHRRSYDRAVAAMRAAGRLEAVDGALVAYGRTLADLCDDLIREPDARWHLIAAVKAAVDVDGRLRSLVVPESDALADLFATLDRATAGDAAPPGA